MELPETRYARSGDVSIAYQVLGDGPYDLVRIPPFVSHVELAWHIPSLAAFNRELASFSRLIMFDKRGTGMSDRVSGAPSLEVRTDDVRAVMDATRSERAALLGHHGLVREQLIRHRGTEIDTAGDGFFASFDGPARAIRCACAISEGVREVGTEIRAGLHTGECERIDAKVGGIAVSVGAHVAAQAGAGEVLVSSTVKDLVAGSGIQFRERGVAELKGVPGEWHLFAVEAAPV